MFIHVRTYVCMHVFICMYVCMCCRRRYVHCGILFPILTVCVFDHVRTRVCMHVIICMYVCVCCRRRYVYYVCKCIHSTGIGTRNVYISCQGVHWWCTELGAELRTPALAGGCVRSRLRALEVMSGVILAMVWYASYGVGADLHLRLSFSQHTPSPKRAVPVLLAASEARCGA